VKEVRALGLLSGGLDSTLAAMVLLNQGIHVEGLYFYTGFCIIESRIQAPRRHDVDKSFRNEARRAGKDLNIPIHVLRVGEDYLDIVKNPRYGRGSAFNPCVDCRIYMFRMARTFMEEHGFDFIFTGEVVAQRPMTQMRHTQALIARQSGIEDLILRPLSAKLLPPTRPEREGLVDRESLLDIHGRGRSRQIALAREYNITDYPTPSGGCCYLTDPNLKSRFSALFQAKSRDAITLEDLQLVKFGRHFLLPGGSRLIVGREEVENIFLKDFSKTRILLDATEVPGPAALFEGEKDTADFHLALDIVARYANPKTTLRAAIEITYPSEERETREIAPPDSESVTSYLIV